MGLFAAKDRSESRELRRRADLETWAATVERCGFSQHGELPPSFVVLSSGDRVMRSVKPSFHSEAHNLMTITQPGDRIEIVTRRRGGLLDFRNLTLGLGATSTPDEVRRLAKVG